MQCGRGYWRTVSRLLKPDRIGLRWAWRLKRLKRRARRNGCLFGLLTVSVAVVVIVGLPIILPLVAALHTLDQRRRRTAANVFTCVRCGKILGSGALALASAQWAEHMARLHREHPGYRFRIVRDLDAVCTRCGTSYRYDEIQHTFRTRPERWHPPQAAPFFSAAEVARLVQGQPDGAPLPFDPADDPSIRLFYEGLVKQIEETQGLRARVEWHPYGSGYASFIEAWFYPADGRASLSPFHADDERHVGLVVLLSRLSRYFVLAQDEKSWSAVSGSAGMPNFSAVDDLDHPALLPHVAAVTTLLTVAGLRRLSRSDLAALLSEEVQVPTILTDQPWRQFDALFYWED